MISVCHIYDVKLVNDFKEMLEASERDNYAQICTVMTLTILTGLKQKEVSSELIDLIKTVAADNSRREEYVRIPAIKIWSTLCALEEAVDFLEKILKSFYKLLQKIVFLARKFELSLQS